MRFEIFQLIIKWPQLVDIMYIQAETVGTQVIPEVECIISLVVLSEKMDEYEILLIVSYPNIYS